jgi:CBS domain-containing membrane protein
MSHVLHCLFIRFRLLRLLGHHKDPAALALFSAITSCISIVLMSIIALITQTSFIFPSLGPTAFLFFYAPTSPAASPRNTICGHAVGIAIGYFSLWITGLTTAGPMLHEGVTWPRVIAVGLSLSLTTGFMVLLNLPHPPAASTTLIVSMGVLYEPQQLLLIMVAVITITLQAIAINRLAGIPYPLWNPIQQKKIAIDPLSGGAEVEY